MHLLSLAYFWPNTVNVRITLCRSKLHAGKRHSKYVSEMLFHDELMKFFFVLPAKLKTLAHFRGGAPVSEHGDVVQG